MTVTRVEANQGWLITCDVCPQFRVLHRHRTDADRLAETHRRWHGRPEPLDAA